MEYHKYLKYKNKYLQLKKKSLQLGGALFYHDRKNDGNTEYTPLRVYSDGEMGGDSSESRQIWGVTAFSLQKYEVVDIKEMREDTESGDWFGKVIKRGVHGWVNMKYLHQSPQDDRSMATKVAMFAAKLPEAVYKGARAAAGAVGEGAKKVGRAHIAAATGLAKVVHRGAIAFHRGVKAVGRIVDDAVSKESSPTLKLGDLVNVSGNIYVSNMDELPDFETDPLIAVRNKLGKIVSITDNLYNLRFYDNTFGVGIFSFQLTKVGESPTTKQLEQQERLRVVQQQQQEILQQQNN